MEEYSEEYVKNYEQALIDCGYANVIDYEGHNWRESTINIALYEEGADPVFAAGMYAGQVMLLQFQRSQRERKKPKSSKPKTVKRYSDPSR